MSRVGKYPVIIPNGVTVSVDNNVVTAKGKLGELSYTFDDSHVATKLEDNKVVVTPLSESKTARTLWGTTRARINTLVQGVSEGFKKEMELNGEPFDDESPDEFELHLAAVKAGNEYSRHSALKELGKIREMLLEEMK